MSKNEADNSNNTNKSNEFFYHEIPSQKNIALVAHDNRKKDLIDWVKTHQGTLKNHTLSGTGTTGSLLTEATGLEIKCFASGPLGGDQQIGAEISYGNIDLLIFFWDPLAAQPHDPDVKALLRLSVLFNVPTACNRSSADFLIAAEHFHKSYTKRVVNYAAKKPKPPV
ncbi:MAG: methylglyoxal synthase [Leptospirales bacterium]